MIDDAADSHLLPSLQIPEIARQLQADIKEINAEVGLLLICRWLGACCRCPWVSAVEKRCGLLSCFPLWGPGPLEVQRLPSI